MEASGKLPGVRTQVSAPITAFERRPPPSRRADQSTKSKWESQGHSRTGAVAFSFFLSFFLSFAARVLLGHLSSRCEYPYEPIHTHVCTLRPHTTKGRDGVRAARSGTTSRDSIGTRNIRCRVTLILGIKWASVTPAVSPNRSGGSLCMNPSTTPVVSDILSHLSRGPHMPLFMPAGRSLWCDTLYHNIYDAISSWLDSLSDCRIHRYTWLIFH